jgi:hypothetical protein
MIRQISSQLTGFYKFIAPVIFLISFIFIGSQYVTGWPLVKERDDQVIVLFAAAFLVVSFLSSWRLKKVYIDHRNIYVSNYHVDATIPITNIARVTEFFFSEPRRVTIHFKEPTIFGKKVVFIGSYRFSPFAGFTSHPIVAELRKVISS